MAAQINVTYHIQDQVQPQYFIRGTEQGMFLVKNPSAQTSERVELGTIDEAITLAQNLLTKLQDAKNVLVAYKLNN